MKQPFASRATLRGGGHILPSALQPWRSSCLPEDIAVEAPPPPPGMIEPRVEALIRATGIDFRIGGDRAYYVPAFDYVQVPPPAAYFEPINWHRTALHEMGHATGHASRLGQRRYPHARQLTITADCGGSNGARVRLWKVELQKLADDSGLVIHVHHYPPGTSKWNKIEHRLFCRITQNWRGRPLTDRLAVVELIGATTTKTGLKVECALDARTYHKGVKVSDAEMASLDIIGNAFHPEWNYTIRPRRPPKS